MTAQYAFQFDARYCSGCKACQAACKDKNQLPPGVLWRRVMEVSGGSWQAEGAAWNHTVFAYNLSLSCNHCVHPKCAGICPTNAYTVREDGIVILEEEKCMGCGYCAWGCPYNVPQYNPVTGHMTKCDFCFDNLEKGLEPACVAACPLRALHKIDMSAPSSPFAQEIRLWEAPSDTHPYPLPAYSHTQPRLAIWLHRAMGSTADKFLANAEEIQLRPPSPWEDVPLFLFTLLGQTAVGAAWAMAWMFTPLWTLVSFDATILRLTPLFLILICLAAGMLASLAHLGAKRNIWRVFGNIRRSSLSKEVLFTGLFGFGVLMMLLQVVFNEDLFLSTAFAAAAGLGLVYNMAQVYRLPAAPGWNNWRTQAGFFTSAFLLGIMILLPVLVYESSITGIQIANPQKIAIGISILVLLLAQLLLTRKRSNRIQQQRVRIGLILLAMIPALGVSIPIGHNFGWLSVLLLLSVIAEESLGRWLFYRSRT